MQLTFIFNSEPNVLEREAEEEQTEAMDSEESDIEDAMETNDADAASMETNHVDAVATETNGKDKGDKDSAKPKDVTQAKPKRAPPVVSSGLPQSKEELDALIASIHRTVTQSILPRLHKCLIAKVSFSFSGFDGQ